MSETLPNIRVENDDWISVNAESGISVGTAFQINNEGNFKVKLLESSTQPLVNDTRGVLLTSLNKSRSIVKIAEGSLEIWAKSVGLTSGKIVAQPI